MSSFLTKAQAPNYIIYDKNQSAFFGAENIISTQKLLYKGFDSLIPAKLWDENTFFRKGGGIGYRALKLGLFDFQVDFLFTLAQHEIFGHGSRMKEFGYENISYHLEPFFPFGNSSGYADGQAPINSLVSKEQNLAISFSGNESSLILSKNLESRMLLSNKIHYRQGLLFLTSRNNLLNYTRLTHFKGIQGDIQAYINRINPPQVGFESGHYTAKKLFFQNLVTLLNPIQVYSVYSVAKTYLLDGKSTLVNFPTIRMGSIRYMPTMNYNLTPFGSEFILNQYFVKGNKLMAVNLQLGDNTFHSFYGGGIRVTNLIDRTRIKLNSEIQVWHQPSFQLGGTEMHFFDSGIGVLLKNSISLFPFKKSPTFGVYGELGYKMPGYVMGEPLNKGIILSLGMAIDMN